MLTRAADEHNTGMIVVGKRGLLELPVDGVAVERRRERHAVLELRRRRAVSPRSADVPGARRHRLGHSPRRARL